MKNTKSKMGRPALPVPTVLKPRSFRLNDEQAEKVAAHGGGQYLRDLIDAQPWPDPQKKKPPEGGS